MARITLRLPDDLHRRLQTISRVEKVSLNQVIVGALSRVGGNEDLDYLEDDSPKARVKRLRLILGDLIEDPGLDELPPRRNSDADLIPIEKFRESLPILDPPLSATIIEEREDRF